MGKGRDKRKKNEDPAKAAKRHARQVAKLARGEKQSDPNQPEGFNGEEAIELTLTRIRKEEGRKKATFERDNVPPPSPRANVVFVAHPLKDNELVIFGGELWNGVATTPYNDLYIYHIVKKQWSRLDAPINPSPRSSCQGVVYKHLLLIHGGEFVSQTQSQFLHFKDVWRFDFRTYQWDELKQLKGGPSCRSGHRMTLWKRQAVVFGGFYDNALECKYFNDLWVLSDLESNGSWRQIQFPAHNEPPHARSGHSIGIQQDTLFVYGGYSSEKFNRFKKSEATVHHDLWSTNLAAEQPVWTRIRLGGIPPPIRAGVAAVCKDKKMLLFGGVVDIESPGGKMVSTFHNDLFVFHMDTQRFYPLVLHAAKKGSTTATAAGGGRRHHAAGGSLEQELAELKLAAGTKTKQRGDDSSSESSESDDDSSIDESDTSSDEGATSATTTAPPASSGGDPSAPRMSYEVTKHGQIVPHRRMDAALCTMGNHVYLFGGQYENGKKEITITDLFSLNLNTMDTWTVHCAQDLGATAWVGKDSDSDAANSWESGSTVVSAVMLGDQGSDEEGEEEEQEDNTDASGLGDHRHHEDDLPPDAIPAELDQHVTPGAAEIAAVTGVAEGRTTVRGKRGMKVHKEQLLAQLGVDSLVPTPHHGEGFAEFFGRTADFWTDMAAESVFESSSARTLASKQQKRCRAEGQKFCRARFEEAKVLMEQLRMVEEREKEEQEFFKELRARKEKEWDEEMQRQREGGGNDARGDSVGDEEDEDDSDNEMGNKKQTRPAMKEKDMCVKGILKKSNQADDDSDSDDSSDEE